MFKKLTFFNAALACVTGFIFGWYAWELQNPLGLIVAIATAIGCLIGGVMGIWPYLMEKKHGNFNGNNPQSNVV